MAVNETQAERILRAVATIVHQQEVFSREDIRIAANIPRPEWDASYSPTFQGMRTDHPGGAPKVREEFRNVFERVAHGKHTLTDYGRRVIAEYQDDKDA